MQGNVLNWIQSFLLGRSQTVVLEGDSSSEVPVSSGELQGFVLGPLLLLLYINDLPDNVQSLVHLFAEDTAVYLGQVVQSIVSLTSSLRGQLFKCFTT